MLYTTLAFDCCAPAACNASRARAAPSTHSHARSVRQERLWQPSPCGPERRRRAGSYIGEDGSRDAFSGLMKVLAGRLSGEPAPPEPWSTRADCLEPGGAAAPGGRPCAPLAHLVRERDGRPRPRDKAHLVKEGRPSADWFQRRHGWATALKERAVPRLAEFPAPAASHRRLLATAAREGGMAERAGGS